MSHTNRLAWKEPRNHAVCKSNLISYPIVFVQVLLVLRPAAPSPVPHVSLPTCRGGRAGCHLQTSQQQPQACHKSCAGQTHASWASGLARRWCQASMSSSVAGRLRSTRMPVLYALQHVLPAGELCTLDALVLRSIIAQSRQRHRAASPAVWPQRNTFFI